MVPRGRCRRPREFAPKLADARISKDLSILARVGQRGSGSFQNIIELSILARVGQRAASK